MTPLLFLVIALAGGLGAVARLLLNDLVHSRAVAGFPFGTFLVNVSGSLSLGFVAGIAASQLVPEPLAFIVGAGFLGGYTTFGTASYDTVLLLERRRYRAALLNGVGMLVVCTGAAALGLLLASAF